MPCPAPTRGSSRWLLLGSLALNLFFVGIALAMVIRAPAPSYWDPNVFVRVERLAATLPPADAEILRGQINANHAAIEDAQAKFHSARQHVHEVLRQEPFDVEAMRAATAQTRAARLNFDQTVQGVFADIAAKITPAGRQALANWPPGAKDRERQTVVILLPNRVALWPGFESALDALGWEDKGGGNDSLGAPVLDNAAEYMRITAARRLPARRRQAGARAQYPACLQRRPAQSRGGGSGSSAARLVARFPFARTDRDH